MRMKRSRGRGERGGGGTSRAGGQGWGAQRGCGVLAAPSRAGSGAARDEPSAVQKLGQAVACRHPACSGRCCSAGSPVPTVPLQQDPAPGDPGDGARAGTAGGSASMRQQGPKAGSQRAQVPRGTPRAANKHFHIGGRLQSSLVKAARGTNSQTNSQEIQISTVWERGCATLTQGRAQAPVRSGASSGGCAVAGPACGMPTGMQRSWMLPGIPGRASAASPSTELEKQHQPGEPSSGRREQVVSLVRGQVSVNSTRSASTAKCAGGGGGTRQGDGRSWGALEGASAGPGDARAATAAAVLAGEAQPRQWPRTSLEWDRPHPCRTMPASPCDRRVPSNASAGKEARDRAMEGE